MYNEQEGAILFQALTILRLTEEDPEKAAAQALQSVISLRKLQGSSLRVGSKVIPTEAAWRQAGLSGRPHVNHVADIGSHPPFIGYARLGYPFYWFRLEDLLPVS